MILIVRPQMAVFGGANGLMTILRQEHVDQLIKLSLWVVLAVAVWIMCEHLVWAMPVLPNRAPDHGPYAFARSALMALIGFAFVIGVTARTKSPKAGDALSARLWCAVLISFLMLAFFVAMFLLSPGTFNALSLEDGSVEWASALLPIVASLLLAWRGAALLWGRHGEGKSVWIGLVLLLCAAVLFVLGMEEISWMQRVFGIATPEALKSNIQGEINFHNFATNQIGAAHKIFGFVVLILLPFLSIVLPERLPLAGLADLIPSRAVVLVSAPLAAFNYNGWDSLVFQATTYLTLGIVIYLSLLARRERRRTEALFCLLLAAAIAGAQGLFLALGDRFVRIWDVTEYKELFIALGLFVWAVETFRRLKDAVPDRAGSTYSAASALVRPRRSTSFRNWPV
jgi:hypothetical protein